MSKQQRRLSRKEKRRNESTVDYITNNRFNMRKISPLTATQEEFFEDYSRGYNIAAVGTPVQAKQCVQCILG